MDSFGVFCKDLIISYKEYFNYRLLLAEYIFELIKEYVILIRKMMII